MAHFESRRSRGLLGFPKIRGTFNEVYRRKYEVYRV